MKTCFSVFSDDNLKKTSNLAEICQFFFAVVILKQKPLEFQG